MTLVMDQGTRILLVPRINGLRALIEEFPLFFNTYFILFLIYLIGSFLKRSLLKTLRTFKSASFMKIFVGKTKKIINQFIHKLPIP